MNDFVTLIALVEGRITPADFYHWLTSNPAAEQILSAEIDLPNHAQSNQNLFLYLVEQNIESPGALLDIQDIVCWFLDKKGVSYRNNSDFANFYDALLKAQPRWLDIPNAYLKVLVGEANGRTGKELVAWLKHVIADRFRYLKAPPKWLQSPQWLFCGDQPLTFVGQLDVSPLRHDTSQLYIFWDQEQGTFLFIDQSA